MQRTASTIHKKNQHLLKMKNSQVVYEVENYGLACACENQEQGLNAGLNGFWTKLWNNVANNLTGTFLGGLVVGVFDTIFGCGGRTSDDSRVNCRTGFVRDYTLTDAEQLQVIAWADKYFSPFYNKLILALDAIFIPGTTLETQLKLINEGASTMAIFKAYLETNPNNFSVNANKEQFNGVTEFFSYVDQVITDIIMESDVLLVKESVKVGSTGIDFSPFQVPLSSTIADLWKVANGGIVPQTVTLQPTASQMQTIATGTAPVTTTTTVTPTETKPMSGIVKFGIVAALSYGVYKLLTKKSK